MDIGDSDIKAYIH